MYSFGVTSGAVLGKEQQWWIWIDYTNKAGDKIILHHALLNEPTPQVVCDTINYIMKVLNN